MVIVLAVVICLDTHNIGRKPYLRNGRS